MLCNISLIDISDVLHFQHWKDFHTFIIGKNILLKLPLNIAEKKILLSITAYCWFASKVSCTELKQL